MVMLSLTRRVRTNNAVLLMPFPKRPKGALVLRQPVRRLASRSV